MAASCSLTVFNDFGAAVQLTGGSSVATVLPGNAASLGPYPCASTVTLSSGTASTTLGALPSAGAYTAMAYGAGSSLAVSAALPDASNLLPASSATIDKCGLRIFSALPGTVGLVDGACGPNCAHPDFVTFPTAGGAAGYATVPCQVHPSLALPGADAPFRPGLTQYGQYTLFVRSSSDPVLTADVAGPFPYWPLISTVALIVAAALLRRFVLLGPVARWFAGRAPTPGRKPTAVGFVEFFGMSEAVSAARKGGRSGAGGTSSSAGDASAPLLPAGSGSLNSADAASNAATAASLDLEAPPRPSPSTPSSSRIESIDALRGACLCIMILANYGGGHYWFLNHSPWDGLTVADLVFPLFVFLQGTSLAISGVSERKRAAAAGVSPKAALLSKTFFRAVKLYALGLFVNNIAQVDDARVLGVLQYFAVAYLIVGTLEAVLQPPPPAPSSSSPPSSFLGALAADVGRYWRQWAVMLTLEAVYLGLQYGLPGPPGCPTGYLGPGGLADGGAYLGKGCTGGAHRVIDLALWGERHIYHHLGGADGTTPVSAATCAGPIGCDIFDPEGTLGWISAAWMTWLGLQAGRAFVAHRGAGPRGIVSPLTRRLFVWGAVTGLLGASLAGFSRYGGVIPIVKNLWSPSFVLVMAGIGYWGLALLYCVVDVAPGLASSSRLARVLAWNGTPFTAVGKNSLLVYVGSETLDGRAPFAWFAAPSGPASHAEAMASAVLGIVAWAAIARILHLKRMYFNV